MPIIFRRGVVASFATLMLLVSLPLTSAGALDDVTAPIATNVDVIDTVVDVSTSPAVVRFDVTASDLGGSGVSQIAATIRLGTPDEPGHEPGDYFIQTIEPPQAAAVVHRFTIEMPWDLVVNELVSGPVHLARLDVFDASGQATSYGTADLRAMSGKDLVFNIEGVEGLKDDNPPVVTKVEVVDGTVDASARPLEVRFDVTASDLGESGVVEIGASLRRGTPDDPGAALALYSSESTSITPAQPASAVHRLTIGVGATPGPAHLAELAVYDAAGRFTIYDTTDLRTMTGTSLVFEIVETVEPEPTPSPSPTPTPTTTPSPEPTDAPSPMPTPSPDPGLEPRSGFPRLAGPSGERGPSRVVYGSAWQDAAPFEGRLDRDEPAVQSARVMVDGRLARTLGGESTEYAIVAPDGAIVEVVPPVGWSTGAGPVRVVEEGQRILTPMRGPDVRNARAAGSTRYETAEQIARAGWPEGSDILLLATGRNFADALALSPLASLFDAPVLMSDGTAEQALRLVDEFGASQVLIAGGEAAVPEAVSDVLEAAGVEVFRASGGDRYVTGAALAGAWTDSSRVWVASGANFPDALGAAAAAAANAEPLLLVAPDAVPASVAQQLEQLDPYTIVLAGGPAAVSDAVATELRRWAPVTRLAGANRFDTATKVATAGWPAGRFDRAMFATGRNFPDALAGAALAVRGGGPVLLTERDHLPTEVVELLGPTGELSRALTLGGPAAVSETTRTEIGAWTPPDRVG